MNKKKQMREAFTLLEMILVLFVISVLLLLVVPNIGSKRESIDRKGAEALATVIATQVELYELEHNTTNVSLETLAQQGYLSDKQLAEAQEKNMVIQSDGTVTYNID